MSDIKADYSPQIRYIINDNSYSIRYNQQMLIEKHNYDYSCLFNFLNTDLLDLGNSLSTLYSGTFSPTLQTQKLFDKISSTIAELFGISSYQVITDFLLHDYAQHCLYCYYKSNNTYSKRDYKKKYLSFAIFLLELHDYYKPDDTSMIILDYNTQVFNSGATYYSKGLFIDYCQIIIEELFAKESSLTLLSELMPPYTLTLIKKTLTKLFTPVINNNNTFRLSKFTQQASAELIKLLPTTPYLPLPPAIHIMDYTPIDALEELYINAIHNQPCFESTNPNASYYLLDYIECILLVDLKHYLKNVYYTRKCPNPNCGKIFYTHKMNKFYCKSECNNQHLKQVQQDCEIWRRCIKIDKRINQRVSRTPELSTLYEEQKIDCHKKILSPYLNWEYDFDKATCELNKIEAIITSIQNMQHQEMLRLKGSDLIEY